MIFYTWAKKNIENNKKLQKKVLTIVKGYAIINKPSDDGNNKKYHKKVVDNNETL